MPSKSKAQREIADNKCSKRALGQLPKEVKTKRGVEWRHPAL